MSKVSTVILNYNHYDDTCVCIDSLLRFCFGQNYELQVVLVDNGSEDDSWKRLTERYAGAAEVLSTDRNLGYAAGNNVGLKRALEGSPDYLCVLNNDTIITEDFLGPCIRFLEVNKDVGFVSPIIVDDASGKVQSTGGDIDFRKGEVTLKNFGKDLAEIRENVTCDYIGGACMVFRANLVVEIGFIPENYFLFFEETEWCCRATRKGYRHVCLARVGIRHKGSATIDTVSGLHAYLMERNRVVFLKRNAPSHGEYVQAVMYLYARALKRAAVENPGFFRYWGYMKDGLLNRVNRKKYPFIVIQG